MMDPLSYFSFQPVLHYKDRGMYYPDCGVVDKRDILLLFGRNNLCCGGSGLPIFEWSFTIYQASYNHK